MAVDLQIASIWKRIAAWILDAILLCVLGVGAAFLLSAAFGYDAYNQTLETGYAAYETQYGVTFDIAPEAYTAMSEQARQNYDEAYEAMLKDEDVIRAYNMIVNLSMLITTLSILFAMLALEFAVPLLLGNGQTVGKKAFGIGLVRSDCVKINPMQLFIRTLLGKYTIETMVPIYVVMMVFWGILNLPGTVLLLGLLLGQIICIGVTRNNCAIHDLLAGTVAVDLPSQRVFQSPEDLIEYTKRIHADRAARKDY